VSVYGFLIFMYFVVIVVIENLYNLNKEALQGKGLGGPLLRRDFVC